MDKAVLYMHRSSVDLNQQYLAHRLAPPYCKLKADLANGKSPLFTNQTLPLPYLEVNFPYSKNRSLCEYLLLTLPNKDVRLLSLTRGHPG